MANITALDAVRIYFDMAKSTPNYLHEGDVFLAWLWDAGFKVVPLDGNEDKQKPS